LFLKSVVSETVRKSAGREFHDAAPEKRKARSLNLMVCSRGVMNVSARNRKPERVTLEKVSYIISAMASHSLWKSELITFIKTEQ